jgi:hypothetical protein
MLDKDAMTEKHIKGAKGDSAKERRLIEALRANLGKRKARARAAASDNKAQARARKITDERQGG